MSGWYIMIHYDALYLSPHLDDVALSCGGQIFDRVAAGQSVLIVTLMAGDPPAGPVSPFAQQLHARWELAADAVSRRRAEDVAACGRLGAAFRHLAVPDCIYRRHPDSGVPLYDTEAALWGEIHPAEGWLMHSLGQQLMALPSADWVGVPLTVGQHVDHRLTRVVAEQCFAATLAYYEDYPYVGREGALTEVITEPEGGEWRGTAVPVSEAGIVARIEAIAHFASQVGTFFQDRADLETKIRAEIQRCGGERIWQRR